MARRKKLTNQKCWFITTTRNVSAFSLVECLVSTCLFVILIMVISNGFLINSKTTQKIELYLKYLNNSQYLYWFFNARLANNFCLDNLDINNLSKIYYDSLVRFCVEADRQEKIDIITLQEFITMANLSPALSKKISTTSNIIKFHQSVFDNNFSDNYVRPTIFYFYIAQSSNADRSYGLYQRVNGRSDQLLPGVNTMQVNKILSNNNKYYIFHFTFDNKYINYSSSKEINKNINKIAFIIAA